MTGIERVKKYEVHQFTWPEFLMAAGVFLVLTLTLLQPEISVPLQGVILVLFWTAHVFFPLCLLQGAQLAMMRVPVFYRLFAWQQVIASGVLGAMLFTPFAILLDLIFPVADDLDDLNESIARMVFEEFAGLLGIVLLVWIGLNATRLIRISNHAMPEPKMGREQSREVPEFWDRVPVELGRDIVAISAELHYMRVYTSKGDALILYPFGKAAAQLEAHGVGMRIHRSHWVSKTHARAMRRKDRKHVCDMTNGLSLPISAQRYSELKERMNSNP